MGKLDKVGSVSAESVKKHTKKDWDVWIRTLNARHCESLSHQELVQLLKKEFALSLWWQQEVARGYQIAIGIRQPQQTLKGTYTTTATKSFALSAKKIFSFLLSPEGQEIWLQPMVPVQIKKEQQFECNGGVFGEFRAVNLNKKLRLTWIDEEWPRKTVVQLNLYDKPKNKCMLVIDHIDLPNLKAKALMHERWRKAIDAVGESLS